MSVVLFRMSLMLDAVKALPHVSTIIPTFDHMAVDTSWERKMLKKLTWLQEPGTAHAHHKVVPHKTIPHGRLQ